MKRISLGAALLVLLPAAAAHAQEEAAGSFLVTPMGGYGMISEASGLEGMLIGGIDAMYTHGSGFQIGISANVARAKTAANFFPRALFVYGQRSELHDVQQPVFLYNYRGQVGYRLEGRIAPYVFGGAGLYALYTDAEQNRGSKSRSAFHFAVGGGVEFQVEERSAIRIDLRDLVYTDWDLEFLNPVAPEFRDTSFPELRPNAPEPESMIHNLSISIGFSFIP